MQKRINPKNNKNSSVIHLKTNFMQIGRVNGKTKRENIVSARTAEGLAPEKNAKLHNKTNTKTPLRLLPIGTLFKGLIKRENKSAKNTQMQSRDG